MAERTAILVPAYQARATVGGVVARLRELHPDLPVLVVDDGSRDGTGKAAREAGAQVLELPQNGGKGTALSTGMSRLAQEGFEWALCLDADGQHLPEDVAGFLSHRPSDRCGVVVGARDLRPRSMPWPRVCSNRLTTFLLGLQAGKRLWDSQCGFRMVRLAAAAEAGLPAHGRFEWESEALVRIARARWDVERVRVRTVYNDAGSHIRPWRDTMRFVRLWFRLWAWILR
jgi:glycosyltransferase involved in cell wall biosynthesis